MNKYSLFYKLFLSVLVVLLFFVDFNQVIRITLAILFIALLFTEEMYDKKKRSNQ